MLSKETTEALAKLRRQKDEECQRILAWKKPDPNYSVLDLLRGLEK
jgi:hypothetical protein